MPLYKLCKITFNVLHKIIPNFILHPISNLIGKFVKKPIDQIKRPENLLPKQCSMAFIFMVNCDFITKKGFNKKGVINMINLFMRYGIKPTLAISEAELPYLTDDIKCFDFDLASHSFSHEKIYLPSMHRLDQELEIVKSKRKSEKFFNRIPNGFIAPYVAYNNDTKDLLKKYEFNWITENNSFYPKETRGLLDIPRNIMLSEPHYKKWNNLLKECYDKRGVFCTFWHCFHFANQKYLKEYEKIIKKVINNPSIWVVTATKFYGWWKYGRCNKRL